MFVLIGIFIAVLIEIRAILTGRWKYKEVMLTILGIGLTPLIQLAVTDDFHNYF